MISQDISRNFDMLNSNFFLWFQYIKYLPETKNGPFLRVSRILAPPVLFQPVLDPLTGGARETTRTNSVLSLYQAVQKVSSVERRQRVTVNHVSVLFVKGPVGRTPSSARPGCWHCETKHR